MGKEGTYLNKIKATYSKPTDNIILNGKKLKVFPLRSRTRQGYPHSPFLFNIVLKALATEIRDKENKRSPNWKIVKMVTVCRCYDPTHRKS